jgi:hypothetical protein
MSKKSSRRWDTRHSDSTSNFWTRSEFFESQAASTGGLREYRFLDNDLHFLDSYLWIRALG